MTAHAQTALAPAIDDSPLHAVKRLTKDIKEAAYVLSKDEARFLVDAYYTMQDNRIRTDAQVRATAESGEPNAVLRWLADQNDTLELQVKRALDAYSGAHPVGQWARAQIGIGPVIAAGLLAHFDIKKAPTNGHFWSFAGLDPRAEWRKGEKRPWNADLKRLCWLVGESFVKVSGNEGALYGQLYKTRKEAEIAANEAGKYADQAAAVLERKKIGKETDAYKAYVVGRLPPAHIHARAKRYAVKRFVSDLHYVWHVIEFGKEPPAPYPVAHLGHAHWIKPVMPGAAPAVVRKRKPRAAAMPPPDTEE